MPCHLQHGPAAPVYLIDENGQQIGDNNPINVDVTGSIPMEDGWETVLLSDVTANNSHKVFAIPSGYIYQLLWVYVELTSTATAGNRNLAVFLANNAGVQIFEVRCGVTQAASLTYNYSFGPSLADLTAVRDTTFAMTPIPPTLILLPLWHIHVWDQNTVDPASDDMGVYAVCARKAV